jgi:hypothetical protein
VKFFTRENRFGEKSEWWDSEKENWDLGFWCGGD